MVLKAKENPMQIILKRFNDPWLDNGLENLYSLVRTVSRAEPRVAQAQIRDEGIEIEILDKRKFAKVLAEAIAHQRDATIFYWDKDEKSGVVTNKKKAFAPLQYAPKIRNRNRLKEAILQDGNAERVIQNALKDVDAKPKAVCILCARGFNKAATNLKQAVYPAVTKIKSLTGVRTRFDENGVLKGMVTNFAQLCPWCYVIGALEWIDSGIIYRSFVDKRPNDMKSGKSYVMLPMATRVTFTDLHEMKELYRARLNHQKKVSNVTIRIDRRRKQEDQDTEREVFFPDGRNTLTLAFYEILFEEFGARKRKISFTEIQREVFREWFVMEVPEGQVKNIKAENLIVPPSILALLATLVEKGIKAYTDILLQMWIVDREGKFPRDNSGSEKKELIAAGILRDDFDGFACAFVPRRHRYIQMRRETENSLLTLITEWRKPMGLQQEQLEIVRKAARAVAQVSGTNISLLYNIEKTKDPTDLLDAMKEVAHKLVGAESEDLKYVSLEGLDRFTELVHQSADDRNRFKDIRNSLMIFAAIEHARQIRKGGESNE
jgi:hypothetical protein